MSFRNMPLHFSPCAAIDGHRIVLKNSTTLVRYFPGQQDPALNASLLEGVTLGGTRKISTKWWRFEQLCQEGDAYLFALRFDGEKFSRQAERNRNDQYLYEAFLDRDVLQLEIDMAAKQPRIAVGKAQMAPLVATLHLKLGYQVCGC
jgi:hypothetical protein